MYKILHKFAKPVGRDIRRWRMMEDDAVASLIQQTSAGETSR